MIKRNEFRKVKSVQVINEEGFRIFGRDDDPSKSWKRRMVSVAQRSKFEDISGDNFLRLIVRQEKQTFEVYLLNKATNNLYFFEIEGEATKNEIE